ncbi:alpha-L-glutamate ligase-like protein [Succinimonas sp.]|uniref:alpha-L-glutamate ligase-like protein n=1 Tax=Succinimonas sp. TaxID=1936151 RepID=UPI00386C05CE
MNLWPFKKYCSPFKLSRLGIMGMNQRNVNFIGRYNKRELYPLVDNKLLTKEMAMRNHVSTTALIGSIKHQYDVKNFSEIVKGKSGFCIKPTHGSGGKGILVISRSENGVYYKPNGQGLTALDVERHITNILAGLFSLGGKQDFALIEDLINFDDVFQDYSYEGVPDVRVIVFCGYPVMCMMRLSTAASDGKANLHQGAVGVGICVRSGKAIRAVQKNEPVHIHPDTGADLYKLRVPLWQDVLNLASSCYDMSGLGYIGTDIVLDKLRGPLLLELNARPGLAIQTANSAGLLPRLRFIQTYIKKHGKLPAAERVKVSQEHFGVLEND